MIRWFLLASALRWTHLFTSTFDFIPLFQPNNQLEIIILHHQRKENEHKTKLLGVLLEELQTLWWVTLLCQCNKCRGNPFFVACHQSLFLSPNDVFQSYSYNSQQFPYCAPPLEIVSLKSLSFSVKWPSSSWTNGLLFGWLLPTFDFVDTNCMVYSVQVLIKQFSVIIIIAFVAHFQRSSWTQLWSFYGPNHRAKQAYLSQQQQQWKAICTKEKEYQK